MQFDLDFDFGAPIGILGDVLDKFVSNNSLKEALELLIQFDVIDLIEHPQWGDLIDHLEKSINSYILSDNGNTLELQLLAVVLARFLNTLDSPYQKEDVIRLTISYFSVIFQSSLIRLGHETSNIEARQAFENLLNLLLASITTSVKSSNSDMNDIYLGTLLNYIVSYSHFLDLVCTASNLRALWKTFASFRNLSIFTASAKSGIFTQLLNRYFNLIVTGNFEVEEVVMSLNILVLIYQTNPNYFDTPPFLQDRVPSPEESCGKRSTIFNKLYSCEGFTESFFTELLDQNNFNITAFPDWLTHFMRVIIKDKSVSIQPVHQILTNLLKVFTFECVFVFIFEEALALNSIFPSRYEELVLAIASKIVETNVQLELVSKSHSEIKSQFIKSLCDISDNETFSVGNLHAVTVVLLNECGNYDFGHPLLEKAIVKFCSKLNISAYKSLSPDMPVSQGMIIIKILKILPCVSSMKEHSDAILHKVHLYCETGIGILNDVSNTQENILFNIFSQIALIWELFEYSPPFSSIIATLWKNVMRLPAMLESSSDDTFMTDSVDSVWHVRQLIVGLLYCNKQILSLRGIGALDFLSDIGVIETESIVNNAREGHVSLSSLTIHFDLWTEIRRVFMEDEFFDLIDNPVMTLSQCTIDDNHLLIYRDLVSGKLPTLSFPFDWNVIIQLALHESVEDLNSGDTITICEEWKRSCIKLGYYSRTLLRIGGFDSATAVFDMAMTPIEAIATHLINNQYLPYYTINDSIAIAATYRIKGWIPTNVIMVAAFLLGVSIEVRRSKRKGIESVFRVIRQIRFSSIELLQLVRTILQNPAAKEFLNGL